jgi:hypothetical protein
MHRIEIELADHSTWRVFYLGATLIERARLPTLESSRRRLALGLTGELRMYSRGAATNRGHVSALDAVSAPADRADV